MTLFTKFNSQDHRNGISKSLSNTEQNNIISDNKGYKKKTSWNYLGSFRNLCLTLCLIAALYVQFRNKYGENNTSVLQMNKISSRNLSDVQVENFPSLNHGEKTYEKNDEKDESNNNNSNINKQPSEDDEELSQNNNNDNKNNNSTNNVNNNIGNVSNDSGNVLSKKIKRKTYLNYNDLTKQLTKEELFYVLNSLKKVPGRRNLNNIWRHADGLISDILNEKLNDLNVYIQEYKKKYETLHDEQSYRISKSGLMEKFLDEFDERIMEQKMTYSSNFKLLIIKCESIDEIKNFIHTFIDDLEKLINYIHGSYKHIFKLVNEGPTKVKFNDFIFK
ncbi:Plasmodium exported protein (PHIST), unknown function [Plasmodium sp. DRC-Itaito]|uniref:Plasmodium RESA N-terminal domain-containing protein n=1 Tax=Plasmodium gaboni TaxID=647221 RepID=A0ABY1ULJ4_9APIC|nr:Plasmodium exported protein (PHIST), unknown function [Plasmodium gaboni]SOV22388.1 Plasmodium exported protein (PHIST), unknown function [Plasmodium sp. DRC-Itaito]